MVQRRRLVYIVLCGTTPEEDEISDTSIYGVFSRRKKAEESIPEHDKDVISYFIIETGLDELFDQNQGIDEEDIQNTLIHMMKDGLVEQLVDEKGNFVYQAVSKK